MASYLDAGAIVTTGAALVLHQSTLNLNEVAIGILSGLLTLFFALGAVVGGRFGDCFGRRRVFVASLVLYAAGVTALMAAVHPSMLYIGVVLTGIAIGAHLPVSLALIAEEAPEGMKGRLVAFSPGAAVIYQMMVINNTSDRSYVGSEPVSGGMGGKATLHFPLPPGARDLKSPRKGL